MSESRITRPTVSLLEGGPYTPAIKTDIRETFKRATSSHVIAFHGAMKPERIKTQPTLAERMLARIRGW